MDHFLERPVASVGGKKEISPGEFGFFRIGRKRAADQFDLPVDVCSDAVDCADESAAPAADYTSTVMTRDLKVPAAVAWSRIGGFCTLEKFLPGMKCTYSAGNGSVPTVRSGVPSRPYSVMSHPDSGWLMTTE